MGAAHAKVGDIWYRLTETQYASPVDEDGRPTHIKPIVGVDVTELEVARVTPKGVWLALPGGSHDGWKRFVLASSRKRFACATFEEARESFIARKNRQRGIYMAKARVAAIAIEKVEAMTTHPTRGGE